MGTLASDDAIALVVPGFYVCAGILLYTAIIAAVMGLYRGRAPLYVAFASTCFWSACISFSIASYYLAASVDGAILAVRAWGISAELFLLSLFVFVALYTDARRMRGWYAFGAAAAACVVVLELTLPYGGRFSSIESFSYIHLPWGESLFALDGKPGPVNYTVRAFATLLAGWAVWRLAGLNRDAQRRDALVLAIYLLVLFAASIEGALIDLGAIRTFYWLPVALVGLGMLMGLNLLFRLREQNVAMHASARRDDLTGLPNRRAVSERLQSIGQGPGRGRHGALLECDLDHFKVVNDALGQEVGDAVLREVAVRLRACAHDGALVARVGGNAFMLVGGTLHASEREASAAIDVTARMVAAALSAPFNLGERSLGVNASLGIVTFEAGTIAAADLIARANLALGLAKRRGGGNVQAFAPQMQTDAEQRFRVVEGLRRAVERGELELRYQPLVDAQGKPFGAESLLRWRSAELGDVSPGTFIPIAEETGLIHALGDWSLRTACERLGAWRRDGRGFPGYLSVNVSPWQLAHPEFVARLQSALSANRIQRGELTLEVTESAVLFDRDEAVAKLEEVRALGVKVALDDFGTGCSSLALVKDLPLDLVKIDQSFVRQLSTANRHLIRVIVAVGTELGLAVVAEGVETAAERDALVEMGCKGFQGYLFARPMPEQALLAWLATGATHRVSSLDPAMQAGAQPH